MKISNAPGATRFRQSEKVFSKNSAYLCLWYRLCRPQLPHVLQQAGLTDKSNLKTLKKFQIVYEED